MKDAALKPMPLWSALLFFGIPSLVSTLGVYVTLPALERAGAPLFWNYLLSMVSPMVMMLVASFVAYRLEGRPLTWAGVRDRFRLAPIRGVDRWWTLALALFTPLSYLLLAPTAGWLASFPFFAPPEHVPAMVDPRVVQSLPPAGYLGVPLPGNWWLLGVHAAILFFNIVGEELWWRGVILPRQELAHGRWTWVVHGLLWTAFHQFWKWNLLILLPTCLALSYVVSRRKNTTIGLIGHAAQNLLGFIPLVWGIVETAA